MVCSAYSGAYDVTDGQEDSISQEEVRTHWDRYLEIAEQGFGLNVNDSAAQDTAIQQLQSSLHQTPANEQGYVIARTFVEEAILGLGDSQAVRSMLARGLADIANARFENLEQESLSSPLLLADVLVGYPGLRALREEIVEMSKNPGITRERTEDVLFQILRGVTPPLDEDELRLIDRLLTMPEATLTEISQDFDMTVKWVSKKTQELLSRGVLVKNHEVANHRLNIRSILLFIERDSPVTPEQVLKVIRDCPYYTGGDLFLTGQWGAVVELAVPSCRENMMELAQFRELLMDAGVGTDLFDVGARGVSHCMDYYSVEEGEWSIPWDIKRIELQRVYTKDLGDAVPGIHRPLRPARMELSRLDLEIADLYLQGLDTISEIRKAVKRGQRQIAARMRALREQGVLREPYRIGFMGLGESAIIITGSPKAQSALAAWAQRLPRLDILLSVDGRMMLRADLPRGGLFKLGRALSGIEDSYMFSPIERGMRKQVFISPQEWDEATQAWLHDQTKWQLWRDRLAETMGL